MDHGGMRCPTSFTFSLKYLQPSFIVSIGTSVPPGYALQVLKKNNGFYRVLPQNINTANGRILIIDYSLDFSGVY